MNDANHRPTRDSLEHAIEAIRNAPTPADVPADWTASTLDAIHNLADAMPSEEFQRQQRRKRIMRYIGYGSFASLAASVAIAIGFFVGGAGTTSAASLLKAMENMNTAKSFQHVTKMTMDGKTTMFEMKMFKQGEIMRFEAPDVMVMIVDGKGNTLQLNPKAKTAKRPTKEEVLEMAKGNVAQNNELLQKIKDRKGEGVESRGKETLNGIEAHVYEIKGVKQAGGEFDWLVWIDPKNSLPMRMEMTKGQGDAKIVITSEFSKWNEALDAKLFSMDVPEGYTLIEKK